MTLIEVKIFILSYFMAKNIFYSYPNIIEASINLLSKKYIKF